MAASTKYEGLDRRERSTKWSGIGTCGGKKYGYGTKNKGRLKNLQKDPEKGIPKLKYATNNNDIYRSHYSFVCLTCSLFAQ